MKSEKRIIIFASCILGWFLISVIGYFIYVQSQKKIVYDSLDIFTKEFFQHGEKLVRKQSANLGAAIRSGAMEFEQEMINISRLEEIDIAVVFDDQGKILTYADPQNKLEQPEREIKHIGNIIVENTPASGSSIYTNFYHDISQNNEKFGELYLSLSPHKYNMNWVNKKFKIPIFTWAIISFLLLCLTLLLIDRFLGLGGPFGYSYNKEDKQKQFDISPISCKLEHKAIMFLEYILLEITLNNRYLWRNIVNVPPLDDNFDTDFKKDNQIHPYILKEKVNSSPVADLYLANYIGDKEEKAKYAVKIIRPHIAKNENFRKDLKQEVSLAEFLNHENIVRVVGFREKQNAIVMEYVTGWNLRQVINKCAYPFTIPQAIFIISQICKGLHYAYLHRDRQSKQSLNIIHGNITPTNILVSYDGIVKISDFGISKLVSHPFFSNLGLYKGQLSYISLEEAIRQATQEARTGSLGSVKNQHMDIFAIGVMFYELLSGKSAPFLYYAKEDDAGKEIPPLKDIVPGIPDELHLIVMKCLEKDKNLRYQNIDEIVDDLIKIKRNFTVIYDMSKFSYWSPEQAGGNVIDHQSDIYSVGIIFYELLTGKRLFRLKNDIEIIRSLNDQIDRHCYLKDNPKGNIPPINIINPEIPSDLSEIVMKCLENEKRLRYETITALANDLTKMSQKLGTIYDEPQFSNFLQQLFSEKTSNN